MHLPRHLVLMCLLAIALAATLGTAYAQVGARAMGMGGAFVGLADDAEAVFYNPAGMAFVPCSDVTVSFTANNTDEPGGLPQDFVGFTTPFDSQSAIGVGFTRSLLASFNVYDFDEGDFDAAKFQENDYWLAAAYRWDRAALGANFRWATDKIDLDWGRREEPNAHGDTQFSWDLGALYQISCQASIGLLIRDVNEPRRSFDIDHDCDAFDHPWAWDHRDLFHRDIVLPRTYSLGMAFKDLGGYSPGLTGAIQVEDLTSAVDNRSFRVGLEQQGKRGCYHYTVRAGYFGDDRVATLGAGVMYNGWAVDVAVVDTSDTPTWIVGLSATFPAL